ncbi:hypothetical protein BD410DRAFT_794558 [Rickenella mellea]|uniref:O-fucosyltransferase family protein n=1 Tax=Rickenella mellea TaxID=50990 RepID=A0A4Y7PQW8_9AGAM|nr:hypothetical protein BD410DRAFT_794558 [Rickenella mellea]
MWRKTSFLVLAFTSIFILFQTVDISRAFGQAKTGLVGWRSGRYQPQQQLEHSPSSPSSPDADHDGGRVEPTHAAHPPDTSTVKPEGSDALDDFYGDGDKTTKAANDNTKPQIGTTSDDGKGRPSRPDDELSLQEIWKMVSRTKGFYARDYSLRLGWNNMRYILEASVLHARLLNRTLILPSFVYARACEFDIDVCSTYADPVNRNEVFNTDEFKHSPLAWKMPISKFIDLPLLRQAQPVILVSEYLRLHGLPLSAEAQAGNWDRSTYHSKPNLFADVAVRGGNEDEEDLGGKPTLFVVENEWFDPEDTLRVDRLPQDYQTRGGWDPRAIDVEKGRYGEWTETEKSAAYLQLEGALGDEHVLSWTQARSVLESMLDPVDTETDGTGDDMPGRSRARSAKFAPRRRAVFDVETDDKLENVLRANGWEVLYTYEGALGMEFLKSVSGPVRQAAPRSSLRGLVEDYAHITTDVLLLEGEVHHGRKPGSLRFTTEEGRDVFTNIVRQAIHTPHEVLELAGKIDSRMTRLVQGRQWMAAHMRRGDFIDTGLVMEKTFRAHFDRIVDRLAVGRHMLRQIAEEKISSSVDRDMEPPGPGCKTCSPPPKDDDPFYLATDERTPEALEYMMEHGVIFINDLLTSDDHQTYGWPLIFTDVLGLVEQAVLSRASYFYAHALSSVAGGVVNLRDARGADPRTYLVD